MKQFHDLLRHILANGTDKSDRTGTGTRSVFGYQCRFDLANGFPLVTTKRVPWKAVVHELLWFIRGSTDVRELQEVGVHIWDEWQRNDGTIGPGYGWNWRRWGAPFPSREQPVPCIAEGLERTYLGVGNASGSTKHSLGKTWEGMMARCYDHSSTSYTRYGGRGVSVVDNWLNFEQFASDAVQLPGYRATADDEPRLVLDKDQRGDGFTYGPASCCWLTDKENARLAHDGPIYVLRDKAGSLYEVNNVTEFCGERGFDSGNMSDLWTGRKNAKVRHGFQLVEIRHKREGIDQLANVINEIRTNPDSRRLIVSAWNVGDLPDMALAPCHTMFQFYVNQGKLSCQLYQRSADVFLGVPFNIASYALLTHMIASVCGLEVGEFVHTFGDAHIYDNHLEQVELLLSREPKPLPTLVLNPLIKSINGFQLGDLQLLEYHHHPTIRAPVAV